MAFTDLVFIYIFLPLTMLVCFIVKRPGVRSCVLTLASIAMLAWADPMSCIMLTGLGALGYLLGLGVGKTRGRRLGGAVFVLGIVIYAGTMLLFRGSAILHKDIPALPALAVPAGVMYLSLRLISYLADVRSGKVLAQRSFMKFMLYSLMFPMAVRGPMTPYRDMEQDLDQRRVTLTDFSEGMGRFIMGLGKTVILAPRLIQTSREAFSAGGTALSCWIGFIAGVVWMYIEFSGWCDMAIGIGRVFGFHISENFRYPFASPSVRDFVRRWHATLTGFFREYAVKPFKDEKRYAGVLLAVILAAVWMSPKVSVLIAMLYVGLLICIEMLIGRRRMKKLPKAVGVIYTDIFLIPAFAMMLSGKVGKGVELLRGMIGFGGLYDTAGINVLMRHLWLLVVSVGICFPLWPALRERCLSHGPTAYIYRIAGIICTLAVMLISSALIAEGI